MESLLPGGWSTALVLSSWFVFFYFYHGLGITLGYHRLLTHKSLVVPDWLKYLIVSGGYLSLMGSPVVWVGVHRLHHQKADIPGEDPHTPDEGFFHALLGWMTKMSSIQSDAELKKQVKDLLADPVFRLLGDTHTPKPAVMCLAMCILYRLGIFLLFGPAVLVMNLIATFTVFFAPQMVNTICHIPGLGYRNFETRDKSCNVWWVGLLALGEGWHNNHHAVPTSARHGMRWFEFDVTWMAVCLLERVGLAKNVVRPARRPVAVESAAVDAPVLEPVGTSGRSSRRRRH